MTELTSEEKNRIYEEEKVRFEAQQKLTKAKKNKKQGMGCLLVIILIAVIWISNEVSTDKRSKSSAPIKPTQAAKVVSKSAGDGSVNQAEKNYISCAMGYLESLNKYDTELATVMAGASTGESTLGDIKQAIQRAKSILDAAWFGDYQKYSPSGIEQNKLNEKIMECRRLHDSAFKELLTYWKDSNEAHIVSGTQTFQRGVLLTNECISDGGKLLKKMAAKVKSTK